MAELCAGLTRLDRRERGAREPGEEEHLASESSRRCTDEEIIRSVGVDIAEGSEARAEAAAHGAVHSEEEPAVGDYRVGDEEKRAENEVVVGEKDGKHGGIKGEVNL